MELVVHLTPDMTVSIDGEPIHTESKRLNIEGVEEVLSSIVDQLSEEFSDQEIVDGVREVALGIAACACADINKNTAKTVTHYMAWLAAYLLCEPDVDWEHETLAALKKIWCSSPDIVHEFASFEPAGCCCLCGEPYTNFGNNPWPLIEGEDARCCDDCNATEVIPARLQLWALEQQS